MPRAPDLIYKILNFSVFLSICSEKIPSWVRNHILHSEFV